MLARARCHIFEAQLNGDGGQDGVLGDLDEVRPEIERKEIVGEFGINYRLQVFEFDPGGAVERSKLRQSVKLSGRHFSAMGFMGKPHVFQGGQPGVRHMEQRVLFFRIHAHPILT